MATYQGKRRLVAGGGGWELSHNSSTRDRNWVVPQCRFRSGLIHTCRTTRSGYKIRNPLPIPTDTTGTSVQQASDQLLELPPH